MNKPLGYWGCNYDHQLIFDVMETFGDNLQELSETDQAWLLSKISGHYWDKFCDESRSDAAKELLNRADELPKGQLASLVRAIANKSMTKPLTYWGCNHELPLIADVADTWGWNLQNLSEIDYFWLISSLGCYYWFNHAEGEPSDAAQELTSRIGELPQHQISALIQALANR
jgi:hypothetical protein